MNTEADAYEYSNADCDTFLSSHGCALGTDHDDGHVCRCGFRWDRGHEHEFSLHDPTLF